MFKLLLVLCSFSIFSQEVQPIQKEEWQMNQQERQLRQQQQMQYTLQQAQLRAQNSEEHHQVNTQEQLQIDINEENKLKQLYRDEFTRFLEEYYSGSFEEVISYLISKDSLEEERLWQINMAWGIFIHNKKVELAKEK